MKFFQVSNVKIAQFFVMRPIFLLCVIMCHNSVDAPITHYDKINVIIIFRYAPDALLQINHYL